MKIKISLKSKLLAILLIIPAITVGIYSTLAIKLFKEDKIAYIYNVGNQVASSIEDQILNQYKSFDKMLTLTILDHTAKGKGVSKVIQSFLDINKDIHSLGIFKKVEGKYIEISSTKKFSLAPDQSSRTLRYNAAKKQFVFRIQTMIEKEEFLGLFVVDGPETFHNFYNSKNFYVSIVDGRGKTIFSNLMDSSIVSSLWKKVGKNKMTQEGIKSRTFEYNASDKLSYLTTISALKISNELFHITLMKDRKSAFTALQLMIVKSFFILALILSVCGIIGIVLSKILTRPIMDLYNAALEISKENFDVVLKPRSNDEVGLLVRTFNGMTGNIKSLLNEIRKYNEQLEEMVAQRTAELNEALALQKAMVDCLDQGFFMFKNNGELMPVHSKAAEKMFFEFDNGKYFDEILEISDGETEEFREVCDLFIEETLPFNDVVAVVPNEYKNKDDRTIHLNYFPVRDENEKVSFVVVVASDKTDEIKALKKAESEKNYADAILKLSKAKTHFFGLVSFYKTGRDTFIKNDKFDVDELSRFYHTMKGNCGIFKMSDMQDLLHKLEDETCSDTKNSIKHNWVVDKFRELDILFCEFLSRFVDVIGHSNLDEIRETRSFYVDDIQNFYLTMNGKIDEKYLRLFEKEFIYSKISEVVPNYNELAAKTASELGKSIDANIQIDEDIKIPYEKYERFIQSTVHIVRNSIDHGIEAPSLREVAGKSSQGSMNVKIYEKNDDLYFEFSDDGGGINGDVLAEKYGKDNLSEKEKIYLIFENSISSRTEVSSTSGRGIGLDEVKASVDELGGQIDVQTEVGKGTTFNIKLPLR